MTYRLFGAELSPYSVKVRSYLRYKGVPHRWIVRSQRNQAAFTEFAKLPLIPLLVGADGTAEQDSTPIILRFEQQEAVLTPRGSVLPFVSALLEEYADEWANKWMFHYRWWYPEDQDSAAYRIAGMQVPAVWWARLPIIKQVLKRKIAAFVKQRMTGRLSFVGSSAATKEQIENSFLNSCALMEQHLKTRSYLFGERPSLADFGVWCQFYILWTDPVPKRIIKQHPALAAYVKRMLAPKKLGEWEEWAALAPTLMPLLTEEVAALFLPWTAANAKALAGGEKEFSVELAGKTFTQQTQKYHARSRQVLGALYQQSKNPDLDDVLSQAGCLRSLQEIT